MSLSTLESRILARLVLSLIALTAASWRVEAQEQYYYPATDGSTTVYAAPTYIYQAAEPTQYVQQPAAPQYVYQSGYAGVQAAEAAPVAEAAPAQAPAAGYGDPYGFTAWLNGIRASYGLGAVGYDPNLASWAAMNNDQQAARGLGHHVMGPARRQNSAMGGFPGIEAMWMASPAHRAALLDPTITLIGIAGAGAWWTFNAN
ncbi:CAP domain-containing protein [Paludisphaera sp.]|uniref:CAP domain-containing protein n=1 Tax=Paludisphaera sp. TaxID=2017432 RepID=UPI00301C4895